MPGVRYTLPGFRFTNLVRLLLLVDGLTCTVLWLTGGHDKYIEQSVVHWSIIHSTFELFCIAFIKTFLLFVAFSKLEGCALALIEDPYVPKLVEEKRGLHLLTLMVTFVSFAYSVTKGGLVLNALLNFTHYTPMHDTYNALVIAAIVFSLLEFLASLLCARYLRRLAVIRVEHQLIEDEEKKKEGEKSKANLGRVLALAKDEWQILTLGMIGLVGSSGATMATPLFFGFVVDAAVSSKGMAAVNKAVLILFLIGVVGAIASLIRSWSFTLAGMRVVCKLRKVLFAAIIQQDVAFFDMNRTGELTNRLSSDTQVVQNAITVNISMLIRYLFQIVGSLVIMFIQSAKLTGVLLSVIPIVAIGAVQYGKFVMGIQKSFQDALAGAGTAAEENISSIRTVRSFCGEAKAQEGYGKEIDKSYTYGKKLAIASGLFNGLLGIVAQGAVTLVLWYGGKLVHLNHTDSSQGISVGLLTAFMLYTLNVAMAFAFLSSLYGDFMKAVGASVRIFELMDRIPEVRNEGGARLLDFSGDIEFEGVDFKYPSRPDNQVLKDVTFKVQTGQMVALVGPSGGGKSTIVSLIEKFYEPNTGNIRLGGTSMKELDPWWFRQKIAMVQQEPTLFACSIKENIAYGKDATDEEIIEAAKMANAHTFITSFEEGYETKVGERGVRLSGGQKQRVAIARALLMDPTVLLLDEATSALDAESEHLVQEAIDRAMVGRTVLVIAHRLSTVKHASQVVVINHGSIAERGTHDELIAKGGVYKKLVLRQLNTGDGKASANGEGDELSINNAEGGGLNDVLIDDEGDLD
ncbi:uncharacterized protein [Amphiura filiformis]|uniref:uncharacterized protein n=1 Tax=Amphiura filiformis TaxID=82378 RepID=UPI003B212A81